MTDFKQIINCPIAGKKILLHWQGETKPISDWAPLLNITPAALYQRVWRGLPPDEIMRVSGRLDTPKAKVKIYASRFWTSFEPFTSGDIAEVLRCTPTRAGQILSDMARSGEVRKSEGKGHNHTPIYSRIRVNALRMSWRKHTNESLGVA